MAGAKRACCRLRRQRPRRPDSPHKSDLVDVVTDFTDSLGRTISVEYESLAQTTAYDLDLDHDPAAGHVRRYAGSRHVVTTETHDDGASGTRDFLHSYETAFVDTAGRGCDGVVKIGTAFE